MKVKLMPVVLGFVVIATITAGLCTSVRAAPPADIPLATLVADGDVIAIVTVTNRTEPRRQSIQLPDMENPAEVSCVRYTANIVAWLKSSTPTNNETSIRFVARSLGKMPDGRDIPSPPGLQLPRLDDGKSYIVMLQWLPNKTELFLPDYHKRYLTATDQNREEVRAAIASASKTAEPESGHVRK